MADTLADAPLLGDALATPFESAQSAVAGIADAGESQQEAAVRLARWVGVVVAALPIAFALILWLPGRLIWIRASQAANAIRDDTTLFAIRALANRPIRQLAAIDSAPGIGIVAGRYPGHRGARRPRTGGVGCTGDSA